MKINEIKKKATTLNKIELTEIKGGGTNTSSTTSIIVDVDVI